MKWGLTQAQICLLSHPTEDKIDVICRSLQICPKLRSFPCLLSGAEKVQFRTFHVSSQTISIKYDQMATMIINGH